MTHIKSEEQSKNNEKDYKYRRFLSQLLAATVSNWLIIGIGLCNTFPFIVIAALTGFHNKHNVNETLSLTPVEASWFASIPLISGPIGNILSALFGDALGRKTSMLIVNVPLAVAWYLMYSASSVWQVFLSNTLFGLCVGLMEPSAINYVGEVCQPKFRGMLSAYATMGYTVGMIIVATLNTQMSWRSVGLVCMFFPILITIALCFVPETPIMLLSKNRTADAEKSLRWLRGWVSKEAVAQELQELQRYSMRSKSCESCIKKDLTCTHPPPIFSQKLKEFKRKQTLKPFFIVISLIFIAAFSNTYFMSTYIVQICTAYNVPLDSDHAAAVLTYANNLADLSFMCLVRFTGKRKLYLTMLTMLFVSAVTICGYGYTVLPSGYSSYPHITPNFTLSNKQLSYIPFICIILATYATFCAINVMPMSVMSELFPYKIRGTATGTLTALYNVLGFIGVKSFHFLDTTLSMAGVALFNCIVIFLGLILMYNILPETENRTLEDIEMHFSDNSKKITDRKIRKLHSKQKDENNTSKGITIMEIAERNNKRNSNGSDNFGFSRD